MTTPFTAEGLQPPKPPTAPVMPTAFSSGFDSGRGIMSPGLSAQSARWSAASAEVASQPHSVLSQLQPSAVAANVSAPSQRSRLLPNGVVLGNTSNGSSATTAETDNTLEMEGVSAE